METKTRFTQFLQRLIRELELIVISEFEVLQFDIMEVGLVFQTLRDEIFDFQMEFGLEVRGKRVKLRQGFGEFGVGL